MNLDMDSNDIDYDIYFDDAVTRSPSPATEGGGGWFCSSTSSSTMANSNVNSRRPTMATMMMSGGDSTMGGATAHPSSGNRRSNNCTDFGNYCFWTTPASDNNSKFSAATTNSQQQNYQQYQQYQYDQSHKGHDTQTTLPPKTDQKLVQTMQSSSVGNNNDDDTDQIQIDDLVSQIAKEMSDLSFKERNTMHEEIHGIVKLEPEDPAMIDSKLAALDNEISRLIREANAATSRSSSYDEQKAKEKKLFFTTTKPYETTMRLNPEYAGSKRFRLMYLRNSGFDIQEAAQHIILHFEWKQRLWPNHGNSILGRPITLADLDKNDMELLESAKVLFIPGFDMAGRKVLVMAEDLLNAEVFETFVRTLYLALSFLLMLIVELGI